MLKTKFSKDLFDVKHTGQLPLMIADFYILYLSCPGNRRSHKIVFRFIVQARVHLTGFIAEHGETVDFPRLKQGTELTPLCSVLVPADKPRK